MQMTLTKPAVSTIPQSLTETMTLAQERAELALVRELGIWAQAITGTPPANLNFRFSRQMVSSMGNARPRTGEVRLSYRLWLRATPEKRRNTVLHEIAHVLAQLSVPVGVKVGHGWAWKAMMTRLGETPKRCHSVDTSQQAGEAPARRHSRSFDAQILNGLRGMMRETQRAPRPATAPSTRSAPSRPVVGAQVMFGRSRGEQTLGQIVKVNRTRAKVKQLESRGTYQSYPVGTIWTVPFSLLTPA